MTTTPPPEKLTPGLYETIEDSSLYSIDGHNTHHNLPAGSILLVLEVKPLLDQTKTPHLYDDSTNGVYCDFKVLFEEKVLHATCKDRAIFRYYKRISAEKVK